MSRLKRMKFWGLLGYYRRRLYYLITRKKAPWDFRPYTALLIYSASLDHRVKVEIGRKFFMVLPDGLELESDQALFEEDLDDYLESRPDGVVVVCRPQDLPELDKLLRLMTNMAGYNPEIFVINEYSASIGLPRSLAHLLEIKKDLEDHLLEELCHLRSRRQSDLPN
jgi:hypothetical protein